MIYRVVFAYKRQGKSQRQLVQHTGSTRGQNAQRTGEREKKHLFLNLEPCKSWFKALAEAISA